MTVVSPNSFTLKARNYKILQKIRIVFTNCGKNRVPARTLSSYTAETEPCKVL